MKRETGRYGKAGGGAVFHERRLFHVGLGAELKKLRELSRMSTRTVGTKMDTSPAWVSRTETGTRRPTVQEVSALCGLYGASTAVRDQLVAKAGDLEGETVGLSAGDEFSDQHANIVVLENEASRVTDYGVALVPGLLQTADYARSVIATVDRSRGEIERRVAARLGRQALLSKPVGPDLRFLLDEFVLRRVIGGPVVMRRQLEYLIACAERSHVSVRLIPASAGAYAGLDGPFAVYEFSTLEPYVYMENRKGGVFMTNNASACEYVAVCRKLDELAIDECDSLELIGDLARRLSDE